jgi:bacteriocin leader peptide (microcyclamide/patellamide family)
MDKQNLMPMAAQPVNRTTTGQLPPELAELSESALSQMGVSDNESKTSVVPSRILGVCHCSYDGDDAE